VSFAEQTSDYGKLVKIDHGSGLETRYAHSSKLLVKVGERVEKGQEIAEVGNTGRSTGPHLHYEIRLNGNALDPRQYLKASS
jgi:murein DD-endopeptidase MepM/ murein hydrolase activator NlpD